jgi:hypothetical protein
MAQQAILTNKSNQRIAAAVAVSGLVGTGLAFPFTLVAFAEEPCTVTSDNTAASQATLRNEIDAAIADVNCDIVTINNIDAGVPLELEVVFSPIYVGPSRQQSDGRTSITIRSTTGLNIKPYSTDVLRHTGSLMDLDGSTSSSSSGFSFDNAFDTITIEGLTFRDSDSSAIYGDSFRNDLEFTNGYPSGFSVRRTLEIKNSRFVNNSQPEQNFRSGRGGAIWAESDVEISNSIFIGNNAGEWGGAVYAYGDVSIASSFFAYNDSGRHGGAVYAGFSAYPQGGAIAAVNSSFISNSSANNGYALLSTGPGATELALNTFYANFDSDTPSSFSGYSQAHYGETNRLWGNIFANPFNPEWGEIDAWAEDLGFNIFTHSPIDGISNTSRVGVDPVAALDELSFEYDSRVEAERDALWASLDQIASEKTPVTTLPTLEITDSSVAVGFVQGSLPTEFNSEFFTDKILVDQLGTLRGSSIDAGAHQHRNVPPVVRDRTNTQAPALAVLSPKEALVPGFAANSTKLTKPMKKEIRELLKASPNLKNVVCKGYTSSPSTPQDRALARQRGKAACDYILTLRPDAQVTIRSGSHTNKPGSQIRRVSIKLS